MSSRYGVSVAVLPGVLLSDSLPDTVIAVSKVISWSIRLRYNGTWLYMNWHNKNDTAVTVLVLYWKFLYWSDDIFILNLPPCAKKKRCPSRVYTVPITEAVESANYKFNFPCLLMIPKSCPLIKRQFSKWQDNRALQQSSRHLLVTQTADNPAIVDLSHVHISMG